MDNEVLQHNSKAVPATGKLLSAQERAVFEQLAVGDTPHTQWVQALLAIDEGVSRAEAAQRAGMTSRQVRYWLAKYRRLGMGMFPQQALDSAAEELIASAPAAPAEEEQEASFQEANELEAVETQEADVVELAGGLEVKKSKDKKRKKKDKKGKGKNKKKSGKKGKTKKDKPSKKSKKAKKKTSKEDNR